MIDFSNKTELIRVLDILTEPLRAIIPVIHYNDEMNIDLQSVVLLEYSAVINLNEDLTVIFGNDKDSAQMISPQVFGMEIDDEDEEMFLEFAKEMLNIISGNCKTQLSKAGINFGFSIPEIVGPGNPAVKLTDKKYFIKRSFDFEGRKIELLISKNSEK